MQRCSATRKREPSGETIQIYYRSSRRKATCPTQLSMCGLHGLDGVHEDAYESCSCPCPLTMPMN